MNWGHFLPPGWKEAPTVHKLWQVAPFILNFLVQKLIFKIMKQYMVPLQHCRNKSSPLLNRNILCGTLLSKTASKPHKALITFLILSASKSQCDARQFDLNIICSIMKRSYWRQMYTKNVYYVALQGQQAAPHYKRTITKVCHAVRLWRVFRKYFLTSLFYWLHNAQRWGVVTNFLSFQRSWFQ